MSKIKNKNKISEPSNIKADKTCDHFAEKSEDNDEVASSALILETEIVNLLSSENISQEDRAVALKKLHVNENVLRESENRYRILAAGTFEGVVITLQDIIIDLNEQLSHIIGFSYSEIRNQPLLAFIVDHDKNRIKKFFDAGEIKPIELEMHHKNGFLLNIEIRVQVFRQNDQHLKLIAIRDISHYKLIDRKLQSAYQELTRRTAELEREKESVEQLLQTSGDGIHILDKYGDLVRVNQKFCDLLGYTQDELLTMSVYHFDAQFTPEQIDLKLKENFAQENVFETKHRRKDGSVIDVEVSTKAIFYDGKLLCWNASRDISDRKKTQTRLQLAASVFTHACEGIVITDVDGNIIEVNHTFTAITGYSRDEVLGMNPRILRSNRHHREFYQQMWQSLLETGKWTGEIWNQRKNGEVYPEMLTISAVTDDQGSLLHYVALFTDITNIKQHEAQLEHSAHYDALTGLPNRELFSDRLHQAIMHSQRHDSLLAVAFLDLDGFKAVNDTYGHAMGDKLLIEIAKRVRAVLRETDSIARFGGDEFVLVLDELSHPTDYELIAERILVAISDALVIDDISLRVSCSIGVTLYPEDNVDADQLIRHADQAMYIAKQLGKNRFHLFDVNQDIAVKTFRQTLQEIANGLEKQEFLLYYQPKVNMKQGKVIGVEALIRWQHPQRGLLLPASFLPVIEDQAIGIQLGLWVIKSALAQMTAWQSMGLNINVSVNIAANLLQQYDFAQQLSTLLAEYPNIQPAKLELEILETSALGDISKISDIMRAAIKLGVNFSLDDFGTGFSSLSYLKRLPTTQLKIDQSFVRDMLMDTNDLTIVTGVVGLASSFRRSVIAEGVETNEHGELLLALGCELAQGFIIAHPMPGANIPQWLANWQAPAAWTTHREQKPNRHDLLMLFLEVEHRQWASVLKQHLQLNVEIKDTEAVLQWEFEHWQEVLNIEDYRQYPEIKTLIATHESLLAMGEDILEQHQRNKFVSTSQWYDFEKLLATLTAQFKQIPAYMAA